MFSSVRTRWSRPERPSDRKAFRRLRPFLEALEDRTLPSVSISATDWTAIGPAGVNSGTIDSGRVTGIAADPTNANVIYVTPADGGVWKTTDGGSHWGPLTDNQITLTMGAIALAPSNSNIIYAGTGEANLGPSKLAISRNNIYYGRGVLKSTDGGNSWTLEGDTSSEFDRRTISRIVVDPTDPNTVYVAVGAEATNGLPGNTGIWKSTDGGNSWTDTTTAISTTAAFSDLAMDPSNRSTLYAAVGDPYANTDGNTTNGIYKSTDAGASWSLLTNFPHGLTDPNVGRITVAVSKTATNTLYASIAQSGSNAVLYKMEVSTNGGSTWTDLTAGTPNYMGSYGDYNTSLIVDPSNSLVVYAGGQAGGSTLIRSMDGGQTWSDISSGVDGNGPHVDHHANAFDANGKYLDGNDGGIWRLDDPNPATLHWTDINNNLNSIQFTYLALDSLNASIALGGSQDNGTEKYTGALVWNEVDGGDGGVTAIDFSNDKVLYHDAAVASFGASAFFQKSVNGGNSFNSATAGLNGNEPTVFYPPFVMDPSNANRLLLGTSRVYETTNAAGLWKPLSTPGSNGWTVNVAINSIGVAPGHANVIYASAGGHVFVTNDHGSTWAERDPIGNPPSNLVYQGITVDPNNANVAYIVADNFNDTTGGGHIWKTTNAGQSWINVSGDLPDLPVSAVALNKSGPIPVLYVGTDTGVYFSVNGGTHWARLDASLPNAQVNSLQYNQAAGLLGVGTNGRGAWEVKPVHFSVTASVSTVQAGTAFQITVTALDPNNNVVTGFLGTVHFSTTIGDANAMLPKDYTFNSGDAGTKTFMGVLLGKATNQTIDATDPVTSGAVGATSILVTPGAVSHFKITAPASVLAGSPFSITVTALDQFNNTVTGYLGTVHFSTSDPSHTLPPDYMFTSGDNGVHTFAGVILNTPGTQTIHVHDKANHALAGSAKVTVTAGGPDRIIAQGPELGRLSLTDLDLLFALAGQYPDPNRLAGGLL